MALTLGAACAAKAFAVSARHTGDKDQDRAADKARNIASIALEGAQRDAEDFRAWLKTHDGGADAALKADAGALFGLAADLERLVADRRSKVISSLLPDLDAEVDLVRSFTNIERRNVSKP